MSFLRRISTRSLIVLVVAVCVVAVGGAAIAVASGAGGPTPPSKPLDQAVQDALAATPPAGITARVTFTNKLFPSGALLGQTGSALMSGASGRLWITADGHGRHRAPVRRRRRPDRLGPTVDLGLRRLLEHRLPRRPSGRQQHGLLGRRHSAVPRRDRQSPDRARRPLDGVGRSSDERRRPARLQRLGVAEARRRTARIRRARVGRGGGRAASGRYRRPGIELAGARARRDGHLLRRCCVVRRRHLAACRRDGRRPEQRGLRGRRAEAARRRSPVSQPSRPRPISRSSLLRRWSVCRCATCA